MKWECFACQGKFLDPSRFAEHRKSCNLPLPKNWDYGWQGDTPPIASEYNTPTNENSNKTPPGEILEGWKDAIS